MTTFPGLSEFLERVASNGTRGAGPLRKLLEMRPAGTPPTGSILEVKTLQFLRKYRFPVPTRQLQIYDDVGFVARVDFAYPGQNLIIEVDSYKHHSGRQAWFRDISKRNRIDRLGWRLQIVTEELLRDPKGLRDDLRSFFAQKLPLGG